MGLSTGWLLLGSRGTADRVQVQINYAFLNFAKSGRKQVRVAKRRLSISRAIKDGGGEGFNAEGERWFVAPSCKARPTFTAKED